MPRECCELWRFTNARYIDQDLRLKLIAKQVEPHGKEFKTA